MRYFRRMGLSGFLVASLLTTACGSESVTGPAGPAPPEFDHQPCATLGTLCVVEGVVTSGADGSPLVGASVSVGFRGTSSCQGIGCFPDPWIFVAETKTDENGSYRLSFRTDRCSDSPSIGMRVVAPGLFEGHPMAEILGARYFTGGADVLCQEAPQRIDVTLKTRD